MRVKVYWKTLALIQSETVMKQVGMNLKGLYYPNIRMRQAIRETADAGQSRIEITYSASTKVGENMLLSPLFYHEMEADLNVVHHALQKVDDICW